jgi:hypothetical protein
MKFLILLLISFISILNIPTSYGQQISYQELDSLSRRYYLLQTPDSIKKLIVNAEKQSVACFILYYRLGILYYDLKKYHLAETYFKKALTFDTRNKTVLEYLYYINYFTNNTYGAEYLLKDAPASLKEKLKIYSIKPIYSTEIIGGYFPRSNQENIIPNQLKVISNQPINTPPPYALPIYIEQNKNNDLPFGQISIESKWNNRWWTNHSVTYYYLNKQTDYRINNKDYSFLYSLKQIDLTHLSKYVVNEKLFFHITYHYIQINYQYPGINIKYPELFPTLINVPVTIKNNHLFYTGIQYKLNNQVLEPGFSFSSINNLQVLQADYEHRIFSKNLYLNLKLSYLNQQSSTNIVFNPRLGVAANRYYTPEITAYFGNLTNYQEFYGQILYNLSDDIHLKIGFNQYFTISKQLTAGVYLSYLRRINNLLEYYPYKITYYPVYYSQISGAFSLKWRF